MTKKDCGMNRKRILPLALVWLLPLVGFSQSFEGTVSFKVSGMSRAGTMKYYVKGDNIRMEVEQASGMEMTTIMNTKNRKATVLMANKTFMEMDFDEMTPPEVVMNKDIDIQKTGKTEPVAGYSCDQFVLKQEGKEFEFWATKGLGKFMQMQMNARQQSPALKKLEKELTEKGYFPLKMVQRDASGKEEMLMQAVSVEKKSLSSELFVIPEGYQKTEMPNRPY